MPFRIRRGRVEFLLLQHPSGHWDFPKGEIEKGEDEALAALRELREETGLVGELIHSFREKIQYWFRDYKTKQLVKKEAVYYLAKARGEVKLSWEHAAFAWLSYEEAMKAVVKGSGAVLKAAHRFIQRLHKHRHLTSIISPRGRRSAKICA